MIISHKYKFIFLHVPKTGGSAIKAYLSQFLGDNDLQLGWSDTLDWKIPYNQRVYREILKDKNLKFVKEALKRRLIDKRIFERPILDFALRKIISKKLKTNTSHATAWHVSKFAPKEWKKYFKFCFVRNPYTHAVSHFNWNEKNWNLSKIKIELKKEKNLANKNLFKKYLSNLIKKKNSKRTHSVSDRSFLIPGNEIYTLQNKIAVDFIGKFENIENDLNTIKQKLKLPKTNFELPHTKNSKNTSFLKFYDNQNKELVEKIWKKEFEFFNYKYDFRKNI